MISGQLPVDSSPGPIPCWLWPVGCCLRTLGSTHHPNPVPLCHWLHGLPRLVPPASLGSLDCLAWSWSASTAPSPSATLGLCDASTAPSGPTLLLASSLWWLPCIGKGWRPGGPGGYRTRPYRRWCKGELAGGVEAVSSSGRSSAVGSLGRVGGGEDRGADGDSWW